MPIAEIKYTCDCIVAVVTTSITIGAIIAYFIYIAYTHT